MSPRRDPYFARFVFTVVMIGTVVVVLGLAFIWYFFQSSGTNAVGTIQDLFAQPSKLAPNQVMLYYTKDGKNLVGQVADLGVTGASPGEKAKLIVDKLVQGQDAAFLKSAIPAGTKLNSVFIKSNVVIVNLSKEYVDNLRGGVDSELLAIYSIVNSLLFNLEGVDAVQLLVEGETLPTLRGNVDISVPLIANTAVTRAS